MAPPLARRKRTLLALAAVASALSTTARASAMGAVIAEPVGSVESVAVRVAVAGTPGRTTRWARLDVKGSARSFAWLVPVQPGARIDLASDAWMEALEAATAPRVVPPDSPPPCGIPGGDEVEGDFTHAATAAPGGAALAADRATLEAGLGAWGLAVPVAIGPTLDRAFAAGAQVLALRFAGAPELVTRTLRVVDDGPPTLPLSLVGGTPGAVAVTAYLFASDGATLAPGQSATLDASALLWSAAGTSTYATARDALLASQPGAWLFEAGGHDTLFASTPVPGGDTVPSLVSTYFFRAASYGDATPDPGACTRSAGAWSGSGARVATACPSGALESDGGTCQEVVGAGEIDPSALRCGGAADDLALALSGLAPGSTWLTRARASLAAGTFGGDALVESAAVASPYGPVVSCGGYEEPCTAPSAGGGNSGSAGPSGGTGGAPTGSGSGSGGASSDPGSSSDPGGAAAVGAASDVAGAAAEGCMAGAASSDSCSGSSSDGSSGDSCSSGSGSDGSSSSDGCGGSSDGSSSSGCAVQPHGRSPVSRVALLLLAIAAFARRRQRGVSGRNESKNLVPSPSSPALSISTPSEQNRSA